MQSNLHHIYNATDVIFIYIYVYIYVYLTFIYLYLIRSSGRVRRIVSNMSAVYELKLPVRTRVPVPRGCFPDRAKGTGISARQFLDFETPPCITDEGHFSLNFQRRSEDDGARFRSLQEFRCPTGNKLPGNSSVPQKDPSQIANFSLTPSLSAD